MKRLLLLLLMATPLLAQSGIGGGSGLVITTAPIASSNAKTGNVVSVTNGSSATDCTVGGGTTVVVCVYNGSSWSALGGSGGGGGVVGGSFGAGPSSGYTFTSAAIASAPFTGNLMVATNANFNCTSTYSAGAGWTLVTNGTSACMGMEYQNAGSSLSYSGAFTYGNSQAWGGTITVFTNSGTPALVQAKEQHPGATTCAYTSSNGTGNLLYLAADLATGPITGVTDTRGNTWKSAGLRWPEAAVKGVGDTQFTEVWYAMNSIAGANTVTIAGASGYLACAEFSGVATSNALVDYNGNADGTGNSATTTPAGATTNTQYTINAVNNVTGVVSFTGRDSAALFRSAANTMAATGGLLYYKNGVYPIQTALQENAASQTNFYAYGMPAPVSVPARVSWHIECESVSDWTEAATAVSGCNHVVLPGAYSGAQPAAQTLSIFWQRPNASVGSSNNNEMYLLNGNCQIPNTMAATATICYDAFTTGYSSHIGTLANSAINVGDGLCTNVTIPTNTGTIAYRTNQSSTGESYFDNTWAVWWYTPYLFLSNHLYSVNSHAMCNQNAGTFQVTISEFGDELHKYQDLHNINGFVMWCVAAGTRIDSYGQVTENVIGGTWGRVNGATETVPGNCTGHIDNSTGAANGIPFSVPAFFNTGNGAAFRVNESQRMILPGLATWSNSSAATTGTTKQTLATYTIPFVNNGGVQGGAQTGVFVNNPGADVRIIAWGITAANGNNKVVEIDFGGTAVATVTSAANNGVIRCTAEILGAATSVQEIIGSCDDGTLHTITRTAPAISGVANIIINLAATTATQAGDFTFKGWTIEYLGGA